MKKVIFEGPFDEADLIRLAQALRECEQRQPDKVFSLIIEDLNLDESLEATKARMKRIFPALPGTPVEVETWKRA